MKLTEIIDDEPIIWHMLEKVVRSDEVVRIHVNMSSGIPISGNIYACQKERIDARTGNLLPYKDGRGQRVMRVTYNRYDENRGHRMQTFFNLGMNADEQFTIKRIDGVLTLTNDL
jgi:hypothetical protein